MKKLFIIWLTILFTLETVIPLPVLESLRGPTARASEPVALTQVYTAPGQSLTQLPNGRWLVIGGNSPEGPRAVAAVWDPQTQQSTVLVPNHARAWHSATVLPTGNVLVFGGLGVNGEVVAKAELFAPETQTFSPIATPLTPRAQHSASLLNDGRVLVAGGISAQGTTLKTSELWDPRTPDSEPRTPHSLLTARRNHTAVLLPSGEVLVWEGEDHKGTPLSGGEWYDPATQTWTSLSTARNVVTSIEDQPQVVASVPTDGTTDVPLESLIALRFSQPLQVESVNSQTITLSDQTELVSGTVVAAEGGMLAFFLPQTLLRPATHYTITVNGPMTAVGTVLPTTSLHFTTTAIVTASSPSVEMDAVPHAKDNKPQEGGAESEEWIPTGSHRQGNWRSGRSASPLQLLPPLHAEGEQTALAGQVLALNGKSLAGVTLQIDEQTAQTDTNGQFLLLLPNITSPGAHELVIDGRNAGTGNKSYGFFEARIEVEPGKTNVLPFTIWLPRVDTAPAVRIPSPTTTEVVVTTPHIPGLELRIPPNTTVTDHDGNVVTEVSITPIPIDRTPFPLPTNVEVPVYFTIQPGGAYVVGATPGTGARLIYPNYTYQPAGARFDFWRYEPDGIGWGVYGQGTATADGTQVVPDPGVTLYEFTGAMINSGRTPPGQGPSCGNTPDSKAGEPIDLCTGLFTTEETDLTVEDVSPLILTRTYRTQDSNSRPFGIGTTHPYAIFLWSAQQYQQADLILPDGARIHYVRVSPGTSFSDAIFEHTTTPTRFYKSRLAWNGNGWNLKLRDGMVYVFGENGPLQSIRDRYGNQTRLSWSGTNAFGTPDGNLTRVTSPNGRWLAFTYDTSDRITQVTDNAGRTVTYTYVSGRLWKVTDANGGVTEYTYDSSHRMLTKKDPRSNIVFTNQYDATGKTTRQTLPDGGVYQFAYTTDANGKITQADVTDPRGMVKRVSFNPDGYVLSTTEALGRPEQQTWTYVRQAGSNLLLSFTDPLGRQVTSTYDSDGNMSSITRLAGTPQAVATTMTYESTFSQVTSVADPLGHTTTYTYDAKGNRTQITNPLSHQTTYTYNSAGQPLTITDPLGRMVQLQYDFGDFVSGTDPLGNVTVQFNDSAGRVVQETNPLGQKIQYAYDSLDRLAQTTNPLGAVVSKTYDSNGNVLNVTDERGGTTSYTYDNRNRLATRTDPLLRTESYQYDELGNLTQITDRKGQVTTLTYDGLNRRTQVTYGDGSTTAYTYDAGNRVVQITDSVSGIITRSYDGLDRLLSETTPEGTVNYTYDAAGRRTSMTVVGQPTVTYDYDNADRLTRITQGSSVAVFTRDAANQLTSVTLPNGIQVASSYDAASRVVNITYTKGGTLLGDVTYTYDKLGNRLVTGGSLARTGLPPVVTTANYNAANQQLAVGNKGMTFDNNGNLSTLTAPAGTTTYTWNVRNQLVGVTGPGLSASFQYDAVGRRRQKTINSTTTAFLYDSLNVVQELSGGTPQANLLTGLWVDSVLMRTDAAGSRSPLTDSLGSTLALTDTAGNVQTEYTYEPFGRTTTTGAASTNAFQYTARENDGTGLYYNRWRYYDPSLQRFISEDPLKFGGGDTNLYAYVGNNPINLIDPEGLFQGPSPPLPNPPVFTIPPWVIPGFIVPGIVLYPSDTQSPEDDIPPDDPDEWCPPKRKGCLPCIPPVGTPAYRLNLYPNRPHSGWIGPHWVRYKMHQNPRDCRCFWEETKPKATRSGIIETLPPDARLITPAAGGGE